MRGAESRVFPVVFLGRKMLKKERMERGYREPALDRMLRKKRTVQEARLLNRAKKAGVSTPTVYMVEEYALTFTKIKGRKPKMKGDEVREAAKMLAKLHKADIVHGDYTAANLLVNNKGMHVIDFGLGMVSQRIEDKAMDVMTMLRTLEEKERKEFIKEYEKEWDKGKECIKRWREAEKRIRYAQ
ncbi:MAG: KEOPS complex kinase/ATPase Bud32 [Candidatus Anstonellales archaeon]